MKKLLALALAMLMLLASAACAESLVSTFSDPVLTVKQGGESMSIDMAGLSVTLSAGLVDEVPTFNLDVLNENVALLCGTMQIINGRILVEIESMEHPYYIDMPAEMAGTAQQGYVTLLENVAALHEFKMPMLPGLPIPKIDLASALSFLLTDAGTADGAQVYTFSLPYSMINQLLATVMPQIQQMAGNNPMLSQVSGFIDQMVQSNSGISIEGKLTDQADAAELVADFYLVQNGTASEAAIAELVFNTVENGIFLEALINQGEGFVSIADMALTSDPENSANSFVISVMNPERTSDDDELLHFQLTTYPDSDLQFIDLSVTAEGKTLDASFGYGEQEGAEVSALSAAMEGVFTFDMSQAVSRADSGEKVGQITANAEAQGVSIGLVGDKISYITDARLRGISDPDGAVSIEENSDQFTQELQASAGALMQYLSSLEPVQDAA